MASQSGLSQFDKPTLLMASLEAEARGARARRSGALRAKAKIVAPIRASRIKIADSV